MNKYKLKNNTKIEPYKDWHFIQRNGRERYIDVLLLIGKSWTFQYIVLWWQVRYKGEEMKLASFHPPYSKTKSKWSEDPSVKGKSLKLCKDNTVDYFMTSGYSFLEEETNVQS